MISPLSFCLPGYFNKVKYRRPAGEPAGPNFAPHTPYANFFLTRAHMARFRSIPENTHPRSVVGAAPARCLLLIFLSSPERTTGRRSLICNTTAESETTNTAHTCHYTQLENAPGPRAGLSQGCIWPGVKTLVN